MKAECHFPVGYEDKVKQKIVVVKNYLVEKFTRNLALLNIELV